MLTDHQPGFLQVIEYQTRYEKSLHSRAKSALPESTGMTSLQEDPSKQLLACMGGIAIQPIDDHEWELECEALALMTQRLTENGTTGADQECSNLSSENIALKDNTTTAHDNNNQDISLPTESAKTKALAPSNMPAEESTFDPLQDLYNVSPGLYRVQTKDHVSGKTLTFALRVIPRSELEDSDDEGCVSNALTQPATRHPTHNQLPQPVIIEYLPSPNVHSTFPEFLHTPISFDPYMGAMFLAKLSEITRGVALPPPVPSLPLSDATSVETADSTAAIAPSTLSSLILDSIKSASVAETAENALSPHPHSPNAQSSYSAGDRIASQTPKLGEKQATELAAKARVSALEAAEYVSRLAERLISNYEHFLLPDESNSTAAEATASNQTIQTHSSEPNTATPQKNAKKPSFLFSPTSSTQLSYFQSPAIASKIQALFKSPLLPKSSIFASVGNDTLDKMDQDGVAESACKDVTPKKSIDADTDSILDLGIGNSPSSASSHAQANQNSSPANAIKETVQTAVSEVAEECQIPAQLEEFTSLVHDLAHAISAATAVSEQVTNLAQIHSNASELDTSFDESKLMQTKRRLSVLQQILSPQKVASESSSKIVSDTNLNSNLNEQSQVVDIYSTEEISPSGFVSTITVNPTIIDPPRKMDAEGKRNIEGMIATASDRNENEIEGVVDEHKTPQQTTTEGNKDTSHAEYANEDKEIDFAKVAMRALITPPIVDENKDDPVASIDEYSATTDPSAGEVHTAETAAPSLICTAPGTAESPKHEQKSITKSGRKRTRWSREDQPDTGAEKDSDRQGEEVANAVTDSKTNSNQGESQSAGTMSNENDNSEAIEQVSDDVHLSNASESIASSGLQGKDKATPLPVRKSKRLRNQS